MNHKNRKKKSLNSATPKIKYFINKLNKNTQENNINEIIITLDKLDKNNHIYQHVVDSPLVLEIIEILINYKEFSRAYKLIDYGLFLDNQRADLHKSIIKIQLLLDRKEEAILYYEKSLALIEGIEQRKTLENQLQPFFINEDEDKRSKRMQNLSFSQMKEFYTYAKKYYENLLLDGSLTNDSELLSLFKPTKQTYNRTTFLDEVEHR
ncbi:hypothetical protein [Gracilibacillus massiliensis]|uniref:hypothetical protein n=1 Tax=Gracilibacillus massiliensis TaxID=1564956 RepID=UPI00071CF618|nr:hypothetical protein [Gracilibacillus massiliensis]